MLLSAGTLNDDESRQFRFRLKKCVSSSGKLPSHLFCCDLSVATDQLKRHKWITYITPRRLHWKGTQRRRQQQWLDYRGKLLKIEGICYLKLFPRTKKNSAPQSSPSSHSTQNAVHHMDTHKWIWMTSRAHGAVIVLLGMRYIIICADYSALWKVDGQSFLGGVGSLGWTEAGRQAGRRPGYGWDFATMIYLVPKRHWRHTHDTNDEMMWWTVIKRFHVCLY